MFILLKRSHWNTGNNGYSLNMSSSRGPYPVKRGPSSRCESPSPKRSAPSAQGRSSSGMRGQGKCYRIHSLLFLSS